MSAINMITVPPVQMNLRTKRILVQDVLNGRRTTSRTRASYKTPKTTRKMVYRASFEHLLNDIYLALFSFLTNEPPSQDDQRSTPAVKLLNLGFGIFILVMICSYTANLTALMVADISKSSIGDIDDVLDRRLRVCMFSASRTPLVGRYPQLTGLIHIFEKVGPTLQAMDDGVCDVAIISKQQLDAVHAGSATGDDRHCNKIAVGQPVMVIRNSWPVRPELQHAMSWSLNILLQNGEYRRIERQAMEQYLPPSICKSAKDVAEKGEGLRLERFTGIFYVMGLFSFFSFSVQVLKTIQWTMQDRVLEVGRMMSHTIAEVTTNSYEQAATFATATASTVMPAMSSPAKQTPKKMNSQSEDEASC